MPKIKNYPYLDYLLNSCFLRIIWLNLRQGYDKNVGKYVMKLPEPRIRKHDESFYTKRML